MVTGVTGRVRNWVNRHPAVKATLKPIVSRLRGGVSRAYRRLDGASRVAESVALQDAWQSETIPAQQRRLVDRQLAEYRAGASIPAFDELARQTQRLVDSFGPGERPTLLEVGCSSGYHYEVLALRQVDIAFGGCDYSPSFIRMARELYPALEFSVADATALTMPSDSVDIVLSGCCILHIPDYEAAIREAARVARRYVIFHRTPVVHAAETTYFRKLAYGVETVEIHFNEAELVSLFTRHGMRVIAISTLDVNWRGGASYATKEYVCEKVGVTSGRFA